MRGSRRRLKLLPRKDMMKDLIQRSRLVVASVVDLLYNVVRTSVCRGPDGGYSPS
jgi:hypothetical protein